MIIICFSLWLVFYLYLFYQIGSQWLKTSAFQADMWTYWFYDYCVLISLLLKILVLETFSHLPDIYLMQLP